ncbi:MAG TPA: anti-sigma factor, partial [Acidimicrobiales bacterium]|nr:anti-sigma factor [Acidimicrobiales bacterium]
NGHFYQAWLKKGDILVPVGTFNEGRKVTLWAGVSPKEFTMFTVTREAADGNQASSGDRVLAGTITP